jgi:hypothetical protein
LLEAKELASHWKTICELSGTRNSNISKKIKKIKKIGESDPQFDAAIIIKPTTAGIHRRKKRRKKRRKMTT